MKEILISGYYGFKNSGDDALLLSMIDDLKEQGFLDNLVVLSANPDETMRIYGVRAISRTNPFQMLKHLCRTRLLISGGGTLIQDGTSTKSLLYYLMIISVARLFGAKVMLYANGIGPLSRPINQKRTRRVLNRVSLITLRDRKSQEVLRDIGVTKPKILLTADPAFRLASSPAGRGRHLIVNSGAEEGKKYLGISIREWKNLPRDFAQTIAEAADYAAERYGLYPVFLPMQPKKDYHICVNVMNRMTTRASVISDQVAIHDMLSVVSNMELCIGMRLHTLIYAAARSVPIIGLVYDPKVSGFMDYAGQNLYCKVEELSKEKLCGLIDLCVGSYDSIKQQLTVTRSEMAKKAALNTKYATELFEKGRISVE